MNARIFKPQTIEALNVLWRSLPLRGVTDQEGTLEDYCFALSDFDSDAIWNTVNALRSGKIEEASKDFCPKAPKLAEYVRAEQKRLDILNAPRAISCAPKSTPFRNYRLIHQQKTDELAKKGHILFAENILIEAWHQGINRRRWPVGATWWWSLSEVWAPKDAPMPSAAVFAEANQ